jgi:catechol 2,3-dioxygenase-like lactoylglutathione lyase family enzyme
MLTNGLNHLGLSVKNMEASSAFFVDLLGWEKSGVDLTYPRCAVTDTKLKLTLWQVLNPDEVADFSRRAHLGLHHLAIEISSEEALAQLHKDACEYPGVVVEFSPQLVSGGPRVHMMCTEPGGLRIEFIWPGQ